MFALLRIHSRGPVDRSSTDVTVRRNMSYANTTSHLTTSGPQSVQTVRASAGQHETNTAAADDYNRIGPTYETIIVPRRQQPASAMMGIDQASARLSEK